MFFAALTESFPVLEIPMQVISTPCNHLSSRLNFSASFTKLALSLIFLLSPLSQRTVSGADHIISLSKSMESTAPSNRNLHSIFVQGVMFGIIWYPSTPRSTIYAAPKRAIIVEVDSSPIFGACSSTIVISFLPIFVLTYFFLFINFFIYLHRFASIFNTFNFLLDTLSKRWLSFHFWVGGSGSWGCASLSNNFRFSSVQFEFPLFCKLPGEHESLALGSCTIEGAWCTLFVLIWRLPCVKMFVCSVCSS